MLSNHNLLHVVALSGGKDSTALALRLAEVEPRDYTYVITPTGNEPAAMLQHWRKLSELLGKPLTVASQGRSLHGEIRRQGMLPNHRARWCTRMLKLDPYYAWMKAPRKPSFAGKGARLVRRSKGRARVGRHAPSIGFRMVGINRV